MSKIADVCCKRTPSICHPDGPKSITAIRKGATARGDSWSTVRRSRKELQVITVFAQDRRLWALPGQVGQIGRAETPVDLEPDLVKDVMLSQRQNLVSRMHNKAASCKQDKKSVSDIQEALRELAYKEIDTTLPKDEVEPLITAIAAQYETIPVWNAPDPALYGEIRNTMVHDGASDPELLKRLEATLKLVSAERKDAFEGLACNGCRNGL